MIMFVISISRGVYIVAGSKRDRHDIWWAAIFGGDCLGRIGVSADLWMKIQLRWDLYFAKKSESDARNNIKPLPLQHLDKNNPSTQHGIGH